MYTYRYVWMHICIHIDVYEYIYVYISNICMNVYMYTYRYVWMYICIHIAHECIYVYISTSAADNTYTQKHTRKHIHAYAHKLTRIHIYTYIHTFFLFTNLASDTVPLFNNNSTVSLADFCRRRIGTVSLLYMYICVYTNIHTYMHTPYSRNRQVTQCRRWIWTV